MPPRVGADGLTIRQRKLVKEVVSGKTLAAAAKDAGYSGTEGSLRVEAHKTLKKPNVAAAMERALDAAGLTIPKTAQIVAEAAEADSVSLSKSGDIVNLGPDHRVRLDAAKTAAKWRGIGESEIDPGAVMGVGFFVLKGLKDRGIIDTEAE